MNAIELQEEKSNLITWIKNIQDVSLIEHLIGLKKNDNEIPQWHKDVVAERMEKSEKDPSRLLHWDEVKDSFKLD